MRYLKISLAVLLAGACAGRPSAIPAPPPTVAKPVAETLHGVRVTDPYRWLEDQNAPDTRAWIAAQNTYTDTVLARRPEPSLFAARLEQLLTTDQVANPVWRPERTFFRRRAAGEERFSIRARVHAMGTDELLIDPANVSDDLTVSVDILAVARDGRLMAYSVRRGGVDEVEVRFFDLDSMTTIGAPLAAARYHGIALSPDNRRVFFTRSTADGPRLYRRAVTGGPEEKLFGDGYGPEKIIHHELSDDGRLLLLHVLHGSSPRKTEIYLDDLTDDAGPKTVVNDLESRSHAELAGDTLVIETNWNAPNKRIMTATVADPAREHWREIVPEHPRAAIQESELAGGRILVRYIEDVKPRIAAFDLEGRQRDVVALDILGSLSDISGSWSTPVAFFTYSSYHVPTTLFQYDVASARRSVFARQNAPVTQEDFVVEQTWFSSKDGTRLPMFVFSKRGTPRDGARPTFLTGYGGFSQIRLPAYSAPAIAWVEQGGVYAVVNLRGGGEFGEPWHRAGMLEQKQNTFDDFIAAGEHLVRERYTAPQHLGIYGTSNGGLLVMAAAIQRPDLFGAVVCRYPLIDMLRYHRFLVGSYWIPEYGNSERAADFQWIHAYSPYHHVKQSVRYPATLFVTGDADTRVAPLHARKMTALMQANGGSEPVLLRYHVSGGHISGAEPVRVQVRNYAEELGFLWWQLR